MRCCIEYCVILRTYNALKIKGASQDLCPIPESLHGPLDGNFHNSFMFFFTA